MTLHSPASLKLLFLALAFSLPVAKFAIAHADENLIPVNAQGSTHLSLANERISVTISVKKLGRTFPYDNALFWGGDLGEPPPNFVSAIQIKDPNVDMFVPLSAYCDLGDVHRASIQETSRGFDLYLYGGDTATSYEAKLEFAGGFLVRRTVSLNEFPKTSREVTRYWFPPRTGE